MECPNCKKELKIPARAYLNLESYNIGGTALIASDCCNTGFIVKMNVSYQVTQYTGHKKEDDWGSKI